MNSSPSDRRIVRSEPSAVTNSTAEAIADRLRSVSPDPWVPVEHAPATEMWGSEPVLANANPFACRTAPSRP